MKETSSHDIRLDVNPSELKGDLNVRAILWTTVILFASIIVGALLMWIYFEMLESRYAKAEVTLARVMDTAEVPPEPRLQFSNIHEKTEVQDMGTMRHREDSVLAGYAWVDRPNGIVRMPIEKAIEIVGERGTSAKLPASTTATRGDTAATAAPAAPATPDSAASGTAPAGH